MPVKILPANQKIKQSVDKLVELNKKKRELDSELRTLELTNGDLRR